MSGHSKWSTIKRKKGALDAKRAKIFTKIIKEITVATKEGGGSDPDTNPRLRLAIQNAKGANMPKDTIARAVKKGSGADAANYVEVTYEGYAPHGIAVFVECMTDNLNRTVANVRAVFSKYGGDLGKNGSLEFIFDRKGMFVIPITEGMDEDDLTMEFIDGGAEEVEFDEGFITISCEMEDFGNMQKKLEELKLETETAELQRIPNNLKALDDEQLLSAMKLIDMLEDDDDVQNVYHNVDIQDSQVELV